MKAQRQWISWSMLSILASVILSSCSAKSPPQQPAPIITSTLAPPSPETKKTPPPPAPQKTEQIGAASFYGQQFHGQETASGETFDQNQLTAAHRSLPLGSKAVVTNLETGKSVEVTINDRGPYVKGRKIDLSRAAARKIGLTKKEGVTKVKITAPSKRKVRAKKRLRQTPASASTLSAE
ncbi:MAG: septal ring lytic transglycosylase RlpA family protein [Candidatus Binatia bacterium]